MPERSSSRDLLHLVSTEALQWQPDFSEHPSRSASSRAVFHLTFKWIKDLNANKITEVLAKNT